MSAEDLRQKSVEDLDKELIEVLKEQFKLRMQKGANELSRNHQFKIVRRQIARIKTIINEKKRAQA